MCLLEALGAEVDNHHMSAEIVHQIDEEVAMVEADTDHAVEVEGSFVVLEEPIADDMVDTVGLAVVGMFAAAYSWPRHPGQVQAASTSYLSSRRTSRCR